MGHHRSQVVGVDQLHQRAKAQQLEARLKGVQGQADALQLPQQGHHTLQGAQGPCTGQDRGLIEQQDSCGCQTI